MVTNELTSRMLPQEDVRSVGFWVFPTRIGRTLWQISTHGKDIADRGFAATCPADHASPIAIAAVPCGVGAEQSSRPDRHSVWSLPFPSDRRVTLRALDRRIREDALWVMTASKFRRPA